MIFVMNVINFLIWNKIIIGNEKFWILVEFIILIDEYIIWKVSFLFI